MSKQCKRLKKNSEVKFYFQYIIYFYIPKRNSKKKNETFDKEPNFMELCNTML